MARLSALIGKRRSHGRSGRSGRTRHATLVPPGLSEPEIAMIAGSFLFHRRLARSYAPLALETDRRLAVLFWRAARLVIRAGRGGGAAILQDLERCSRTIDRYERTRPGGAQPQFDLESLDASEELDRLLDLFLTGPNLPLDLLLDHLVPELPRSERHRLAAVLQDLIRDLAEQLGFARPVNL